MHIAGIKEAWNQPRCWSDPSRYKSAGKASSGLRFSTAWLLTPESNQTSRISFPFSAEPPPHDGQRTPEEERKSFTSRMNQQSVPSAAVNFIRDLMTAGSKNSSPHSLQTSAGTGTPQYLWRERHQCGRDCTIDLMRSLPAEGIQPTSFSIASSSLCRRSAWSKFRNHCFVARKMIGVLQRQQCG